MMKKINFLANLQRVEKNPVLRSALKYANGVGLLDTMMSLEGPQLISTIAKRAELKERHTWELTQALYASGLLEMNEKYQIWIPNEIEKGIFQTAAQVEYQPDLGEVVGELEKCYKLKGPEGYDTDKHPNVMRMVNEMRKHQEIAAGIAKAIATYKGKDVKTLLDVGCGSGDITFPLALECPGIQITGCDVSEDAIKLCALGPKEKNLTFTVTDGISFPKEWTKKYDVILFYDVLHDLPQPEPFMKNVTNVLKDDGIMIIVDPKVSSIPLENQGNLMAATALTISSFYCVPIGCCNKGIGLGVSWGEQNKEMFLNKVGLQVKHKIRLTGNDFDYAFICSKGK